ncbi:MAG: 2-succinyl-5-enolpyruvyl-6-hydroxy-3-cyclohexene-1-carboxylic-acid synthase [candidate division Zixibacteria bacterium]|nr:2-succinyl-5-enolpyruvyl-6-hydroxy-3-cyclohexene-1-carboxylic-acid synthase [candidate division Zixibacteria bacterium]
MSSANINSVWADLMVEELYRCGVTCVVLSPGSRCTPLTAAFAGHPFIDNVKHFDERGAAFFALGHARATGEPTALLCTSGTAVANNYPAVIEASIDNLPLIVLSADRPPELRDTGANQTIRQVGIYADYPRWHHDFPCPSADIDPRYVLTTIDQAVYRATRMPSGPVHLNTPFREPLAPLPDGSVHVAYFEPLKGWQNSQSPFTIYEQSDALLSDSQIADVVKRLNTTERGALAVGRLEREVDISAARELADTLKWPVIADIMSGLRLTDSKCLNRPFALRSKTMNETLTSPRLDTVLHLGGQITAKETSQWLANRPPARYLRVADSPARLDPGHEISDRYEMRVSDFCRQILPSLSPLPESSFEHQRAWFEHALRCDGSEISVPSGPPDEIAVAVLLSRHLPPDAALFLASSMPIRRMDTNALTGCGVIRVGANRGASGIDGTIASAAGYAAGLNKHVVLLIGDTAALHDLNSLALVAKLPTPVTIIIVNNDGGGIFEQLPISRFPELCEEYFVMPHGLYFEDAAGMFGLPYHRINTNEELVDALRLLPDTEMSRIVEIVIDRSFTNPPLKKKVERRQHPALRRKR